MWEIQIVEEEFVLSEDFRRIDLPSGGFFPSSMEIIPGRNALLVTDITVGVDIIDLVGSSSSVIRVDGQQALGFSSFNSRTGNFILTDVASHVIHEVSISEQLEVEIIQVRTRMLKVLYNRPN